MKKEIELVKRKPTFDYILNDLAFESLKLKVIHGIASNQDKFDFDYQLKLKEKEIERLNNIIYREISNYIQKKYGMLDDTHYHDFLNELELKEK